MRVLVTCQPARGHFHPVVPLLRAIQASGHEPIVVTSASFVPVVARAGIAAVAAGADWLESAVDAAFPDVAVDATDQGSMQHVWRDVFSRAARRFLPPLIELVAAMRPDLVLSEGFEYMGPLAAETAGIPHVQMGIGPLQPLPLVARSVGPYWEAVRANLGLRPDPTLQRLVRYLYLSAYPPSFQPLPLEALSSVAVSVRPTIADVDGDQVRPAGSRPLVYVAMGTVFNRVRGIFETVLEALADEPVQVIAAVGENRDPAELAPWPDNARVVRFVRQAELLPHVAAVVFHGGSASTVAALANGVPTLAIPLGADQEYNAFRLESAGAGLRVSPTELTVARVRTSVQQLLHDPIVRLNAGRLRREIEQLPPMARAVALLERLVTDSTTRAHRSASYSRSERIDELRADLP